jgi:hypothetical protein
MLNMKVSAANTVKIGVLFPKYLTQGGGGFGGSGHGGMYDGAQMAAQEINSAGGINVNESYVKLLGEWGQLIMLAYFGGRTAEKIMEKRK